MKILRVIGSMDPSQGGPCQGIRNTIPALGKLGVYNEVVTLDDPASPFLDADPFKIHALGRSKGPWGYSSKLIPWLLDNISRFDAIIVHGLWQYFSHATGIAVSRFRKLTPTTKGNGCPKLFVMPHGMLDPYFQRAPDRRLKAIRNVVYWKLIERNVINNADGVLFTCQAELLLARETFSPYHPKVELNIGYGIQPPPAYSESMRTEFLDRCPELRDQTYILFLSRIHEKKGIDLLINAYQAILDEKSPKLVIAGPGLESPYGRKLQQLVANNEQLKHAVSFPGMLSGDAKWGAFYNCEAFVLPSHQENFGIAVVEALACFKPVLISDQVNIWREIKEMGAGIIEPDTLGGTLLLLQRWNVNSKEEKLAMGKNARRCFENNFAVDHASMRMKEAIGRLLK